MSITDKKQALSQGKPLSSSSKMPLPKKEKDTTAYYGDNRATHEENRKWLREHANEVLRITHGRVTLDKLEEYERKLSDPAKWGTSIEKSAREPGRMKIAMTKEEDKAKPLDKFDKREDMEIARRMWEKK